MDQADPEIENLLHKSSPSISASHLLRSTTSIDVAYAVFGLESYSGLRATLEPNNKLLFASIECIPRPAGFFTAVDAFIPALAITTEEAIFEKLKLHFSASNRLVFSYKDVGDIQNEFDMYTYTSQINSIASKVLSNNGVRGFDLMQVNEALSLPPIVRLVILYYC